MFYRLVADFLIVSSLSIGCVAIAMALGAITDEAAYYRFAVAWRCMVTLALGCILSFIIHRPST